MTLAVQNAIALALSEQVPVPASPPHVKNEATKPEELSVAKPIDIRRSFNGLRVGLPLIGAALGASEDPDAALSQMMELIKKLSSELLDNFGEGDPEQDIERKTAMVRTAILKSVEIAAINGRLEDINADVLLSLINQCLEITIEPGEYITGDSNFDIQFLVTTGLTASTFIESKKPLRLHLNALLDITHKTFSSMLKHSINTKQLKIIEQSFLPDVAELYKRVAKDEHRKSQIELLGSDQGQISLPTLIEKRFQVYLSGVVDAAISNSEVTK